jgi:hypothetical protein
MSLWFFTPASIDTMRGSRNWNTSFAKPALPREQPMKRLLAFPFIFLIWLYRKIISPLKPPTCRFYPTCSAYALEAISKYGAFKGGGLAMKRLLRCHPMNPGGFDPVP